MPDQYSWVPFHQELAEALLPYRSRQDELIEILRDLEAQGYPVIRLENKRKDESTVPLSEIDPFTFLASLNRGIKPENRQAIAEAFKQHFGLRAPTPKTLQGIPTVNNQSSWFFGWHYHTEEGDIPSLWDLAENVIHAQGASDLAPNLFDRCLEIRAVGLAKLTMGLFWVRPDLFLPLDKKSQAFLSDRGFETDISRAGDYLDLLEKVKAQHGDTSLPELSYRAHLAATKGSESEQRRQRRSDPSFRVWLLASGRGAEFWDDWTERGIIAVGWDALGDLSQYGSREEVADAMREEYDSENDPKNNSRACWEFAHEMAEGDLVFMKEGRSTLRGAGVVRSGFRHAPENRKRNRNLREMEWLRTGKWQALPRSEPRSAWGTKKKKSSGWRSEPRYLPRKTLTDITGYRSMRSELEICVGLDRAEVIVGREEACPIKPDVLDAAAKQTILPQAKAGAFEDPGLEGYLRESVIPEAQAALLPESVAEDPAGAVKDALHAHENLLHGSEIAKATEFAKAAAPNDLRSHLEALLRGGGDVAARARRFLEWGGEQDGPGENTVGFNGTTASYLMAVSSPATCAFCKPSVYAEAAERLLGKEHVAGAGDEAERIGHATRLYSDLLRLLRRQYDLPFHDLMHVHSALYVLAKSTRDGVPQWGDLQTDETALLYTVEEATSDLFYPPEEFEKWLDMLRTRKNVILQGPPGVGKTFVARRLAYALMGHRDDRRVEMVQFHQSYAYEDFIQGYRPDPAGGGFRLRNGVFYRFCQRAQNDDQSQPYVFIIDEINRGNLSKILGELMMLIEPEKRGQRHAVPLAYGEETGSERFYVPENLHLIGMMNTADRSLAMVDYALRRRFGFVDMEPRFTDDTFRSTLEERGASDTLIDRIVDRLGELNQTIAGDTANLGPGFRVGHSYFCPGEGVDPDADWYERVVRREVGPLLREYWFDDRERAEDLIETLLA